MRVALLPRIAACYDRPEKVRRAIFILGGFVSTAGILWIVLWLGAWGFGYRRWSLHQGRLTRVLEQKPTVDQITEGLRAEGTSLL